MKFSFFEEAFNIPLLLLSQEYLVVAQVKADVVSCQGLAPFLQERTGCSVWSLMVGQSWLRHWALWEGICLTHFDWTQSFQPINGAEAIKEWDTNDHCTYLSPGRTLCREHTYLTGPQVALTKPVKRTSMSYL